MAGVPRSLLLEVGRSLYDIVVTHQKHTLVYLPWCSSHDLVLYYIVPSPAAISVVDFCLLPHCLSLHVREDALSLTP